MLRKSYVSYSADIRETRYSSTGKKIREELEITDKKIYAYMPTWRGTVDKVGVSKNDAYLMYYLCELDKRLTDDEIFYINIHPMAMHAKNTAEVSKLKHIKNFPAEYIGI